MQQLTQLLKKISPDLCAIILFILLGVAYFFTPLSQGLVLNGSDHTGGIGSGQELTEYHNRTGEETRWTNSLFSGMPTYQISPSYHSRTALSALRSVYELGLPSVVMYVFILLLGFYILMRAIGYKPALSVLGAIAWAFSSYFFIIIGAGHIWKLLTLAFIPPTIAGMVLCYKGKYIWGGAVLALFLAFQILSNHLQMTYYFLPVMLLMSIACLIDAIRQKWLPRFCKGLAAIVVGAALAVCANLPNLYHTYQYSKETMRGRSELAQPGDSQRSGLSAEYITQWSYGIDETLTLLIPNAKGGASVPLSQSEIAMEKGQYPQVYNQIGMYWGNQPGTSGPVYVGAFVLMLFFLGLFVVKGPMKWALLVATVLSLLMSWGHNAMWFTQFCIDYVPLYNKFRTVSSALVVAEFTIPLLAVMALARVLKEREAVLGNKMWKLWVSFALTGGVALLYALCPGLFAPFVSISESEQLAQYPQILGDITAVREAIFSADAWRSFIIVLVGTLILLLYFKTKFKAIFAVIALALLCLIDMYSVNKRYLNDGMFVFPQDITDSFQKTSADEQILKDKSLDYRVLNFTTNTFNENETSFYHKSIGGYSAVKLGRYQDLINRHISPEMNAFITAFNEVRGQMPQLNGDSVIPVLNMLNCKYFILGTQETGPIAVENPYAMGNGWFVDALIYVDTPNQEIDALSTIDLRRTAVADASFKNVFKDCNAGAINANAGAINASKGATQAKASASDAIKGAIKAKAGAILDSLSTVTLTRYEPNALEYKVASPQGGLVVFSEVFYPGWKATIDGKPLELGRVDYILRAAVVPAGNHIVKMEYKPQSVAVTETIAYIAIVLLVLAFVGAIIYTVWRARNDGFAAKKWSPDKNTQA